MQKLVLGKEPAMNWLLLPRFSVLSPQRDLSAFKTEARFLPLSLANLAQFRVPGKCGVSASKLTNPP